MRWGRLEYLLNGVKDTLLLSCLYLSLSQSVAQFILTVILSLTPRWLILLHFRRCVWKRGRLLVHTCGWPHRVRTYVRACLIHCGMRPPISGGVSFQLAAHYKTCTWHTAVDFLPVFTNCLSAYLFSLRPPSRSFSAFLPSLVPLSHKSPYEIVMCSRKISPLSLSSLSPQSAWAVAISLSEYMSFFSSSYWIVNHYKSFLCWLASWMLTITLGWICFCLASGAHVPHLET